MFLQTLAVGMGAKFNQELSVIYIGRALLVLQFPSSVSFFLPRIDKNSNE
jgi:hypothetical protein